MMPLSGSYQVSGMGNQEPIIHIPDRAYALDVRVPLTAVW